MQDLVDIMVVNNFVLPVNLTACSALSFSFPVTVGIYGQSYFEAIPDRPYVKQVEMTQLQGLLAD